MTALPIKHLVAPFQYDAFEDDVISRSLLIEERRQTRAARRAIALCVAGLAVFIAWASVAPVYETVTVSGALVPSAQVRQVQHLEGGIIEAVLVNPGDRVAEGDVLLRLDGTQIRAELAKARARLDAVTLSANRLRALAAGDPNDLAGDGALAAILESQRAAWRGAQMHLTAQLGVLHANQRAKEAQLPALEAQRKAAEEELALLRRQLADQETTLAAGLTVRRERDQTARAVLELQRKIAELDGAIVQVDADLAAMGATEDELLTSLQRDALVEVASLETQRAEVAALVDQLSERLGRLEVVSPVGGIVHVLGIDGPREVLAPGDTVAEIVPEEGPVIARVEVPAERIGAVSPGAQARVRILTYDYIRFGTLDAVVELVSPTSMVTPQGHRVYEAHLKLETDRVGPETAGLVVRPGMTISADITGDQKTILAYLMKPLRVLSDRSLTEE